MIGFVLEERKSSYVIVNSAYKTSQENGVGKRMNRTLVEAVYSMLLDNVSWELSAGNIIIKLSA